MKNKNYAFSSRMQWISTFIFAIICFVNISASEPIAVYLTWQHSPTTTMTIQWITDGKSHEDAVQYQSVNDNCWKNSEGFHFLLPTDNRYIVHSLELKDLSPGMEYRFKVLPDDRVYKFRTMPANTNVPIRFVVGGDMYHDSLELLEQMNALAAKQNPDFALLGGDLAYVYGKSTTKGDTKRWIEWLTAWSQKMVATDGRLVPVLAAVGNHDVPGGFDQPPEQAAIYAVLFPMPGFKGYDVVDFGNYLSIFILNSGHFRTVAGEQTAWLKTALSDRQTVPSKLAIYHVPAYPSFRPFENKDCKTIRNNWIPLFETYGLNVAFENHDHTYKRTYPLRNNQIDRSGVVYMGDGAWAVEKARIPHTPKELFYLARSAAKRHFILVTMQGQNRLYQAIDSTGQVFDEFKQSAEIK